MTKKNISLFLFTLFTLSQFFVSSPGLAESVPVFDGVYKYRPGSESNRSKKRAAAESKQIKVLGKYGDISAVKRKDGSRLTVKENIKNSPNSLRKHVTARAIFILDADTGDTIYSYNATTPRQPASTIKIVTAMIGLKKLKKNDKILVSKKAAGMPRSKIYLKRGKTYNFNDLIHAILLRSANDASVAVAEKIGATEQKFARMMTREAKLLGAKKTNCKTASGLTAKGQYSTARDLAVMFKNAMQNKDFARIVKTRKHKTAFGTTLNNKNKALWQIKGTMGGKTGYTFAAKKTYVGQFRRNGKTIVVAIMGSDRMWEDLKYLVEYGFKNKK